MKTSMVHSQDITAIMMRFEGCRLKAYQDIAGVWTIGFGHTQMVYAGQIITLEQANEFLNQDLRTAEHFVNALVQPDLDQKEFDALVDFVFNVGCERFKNSTMLRLINENRFHEAAGEFDKWDISSGKPVAGLLARRQVETEIFNEGIGTSGIQAVA